MYIILFLLFFFSVPAICFWCWSREKRIDEWEVDKEWCDNNGLL